MLEWVQLSGKALAQHTQGPRFNIQQQQQQQKKANAFGV